LLSVVTFFRRKVIRHALQSLLIACKVPCINAAPQCPKPSGIPGTLVHFLYVASSVLTSSPKLWPLLYRNDIFGARDAGCFAWLWGMDVLTFDEVSRKMLHEEEHDDPDSDAILSPIS